MASLLQKLRYAARMPREHPGVAASPALFFRRLAAWRLLTAVGRDATVPFDRYGVSFYCPSEWRGMSKMAYTLRDFCEPELPHLGRWVEEGATVVDIGAHYGSYTLPLAQLVGGAGKVVAVEPARHALGVLRHNIAMNGLRNVEIQPVALGDRESTAALHLHGDLSRASLNDFTDGGVGSEQVPVRRLDDVITSRVAFVKIDVEGYELPALQGATRILSEDRPRVLFELQPAAATRAGLAPFGVWELLAGLGYRFVQLGVDGQLTELREPAGAHSPNVVAEPA